MPAIWVVGTRSANCSLRPLVSGTVTLAQLRRRSVAYRGVVPAVMFVESEVSKAGLKTDRRFTNGYITHYRLNELAVEWDRDGLTTIDEFLDAIECELAGSARCAAVSQATQEVGREAVAIIAIEADW